MEAAFFGEKKILPWKGYLAYFVVWSWFHKAKRTILHNRENRESGSKSVQFWQLDLWKDLVGSLVLETVYEGIREERNRWFLIIYTHMYVCRCSWWLQVGFMTPEDFWKHGGLAEEKVPLAAVAHHGQLSNGIQTRRYVGIRSETYRKSFPWISLFNFAVIIFHQRILRFVKGKSCTRYPTLSVKIVEERVKNVNLTVMYLWQSYLYFTFNNFSSDIGSDHFHWYSRALAWYL